MKRLICIMLCMIMTLMAVGCKTSEKTRVPAPDTDPPQPVSGTIEGYVYDGGAPVTGVTVTVGEHTVKTMRSGKFAIHGVSIADGTLSFNKYGYFATGLTVSADDFVNGTATYSVDFAKVATVSGTVYDMNGDPLPSVKVEGGGSTAVTDEDGTYVLTAFRRADGTQDKYPFSGLMAKDGYLTFTKETETAKYKTVRQLVRAEWYDADGNLDGLETFMHRMAKVTGRVAGPYGTPLKGAVVGCGSESSTTDAGGNYTLWLYPETTSKGAVYRIYYSMTGYNATEVKTSFGQYPDLEYAKDLGTTTLTKSQAKSDSTLTNSRTDGDRMNVYGRTLFDYDENADLVLNVMSGFEVTFRGTYLKVDMKSLPEKAINPDYRLPYSTFCVFVDGKRDPTENVISCATAPNGWDNEERTPIYDWHTYTIVDGLSEGEHTVMFVKTDDPLISTCLVKNYRTDGKFLSAPEKPALKIEVFGDSITTGGDNMLDRNGDGVLSENEGSHDVVPENSNGAATYATYAAFDLNAEINVFARCGICLYGANAGDTVDVVSKIYKQVSPKNRTAWNMYEDIPDIVIINLGSNDQFGDMSGFSAAYAQMVRELASYYGKDTTFVLVHGFADLTVNKNGATISPTVGEAVETTLNTLKSEGYDVHKITYDNAPYFHPLAAEHRQAANKLTSLLRSLGY